MNKQNKYLITKEMAKKGIKVRTWAIAQGYSEKDVFTIQRIACGQLKGARGRAYDLKKDMIEAGVWVEEKEA